MSELKACPFCGGDDLKAMREERPYPDGIKAFVFKPSFHIQCVLCGARTLQYHGERSLDAAIAAWNRRAGNDRSEDA